jgi:hypothetical protein
LLTQDSELDIVTRIRAGRLAVRILVETRILSIPQIVLTGAVAHLNSHRIGTGGLFKG